MIQRRHTIAVAALAVALGLARPGMLVAQTDMTPEEIIGRSRLAFYYAGDDMKARVMMELVDKAGHKRIRELTMLRKDYKEGGDQKYFIYFHRPADVKDMTFMVAKYPDKDDDRWVFITAINLVKRIAASDKYASFVGSDFTYEDVSGRKPEEDTHTLLRKEEVNGKNCYVIESVPKGTSEYTKRTSWIDEVTFLPMREDFYDRQNELYRQFEALETKEIGSLPTVTRRVMRSTKSGHRTEVTFLDVEYNVGVEDELFSERYLRKPPPEWTK